MSNDCKKIQKNLGNNAGSASTVTYLSARIH